MPRVRPKLAAAQQLAKQAREGRPVQRVEIPRVTCPRCGTGQFALPDGTPRAHLRAARPGEAMYSALIPTMTGVRGVDMTLEEHYRSLPDELRVKRELIPLATREASAYATDLDAMLDAGTPVTDLPTYTEWVNRG